MFTKARVQALIHDLEHGPRTMQLEALRQLRQLRQLDFPEVVDAVIRKLLADTWTDVRAEAASCLSTFDDAHTVPALLSVLNEGPEIRDAALASLTKLVGVDQLPLLRLTYMRPDPALRREAILKAASQGAGSRSLWGNRLEPVQRWATEVLTDLRDHGTPEDIPSVRAVLEHEKTHPRYHRLVLEALLAIARRHPTVDLQVLHATIQKHALSAPTVSRHREILRQLEALSGATLPRPATPAPTDGLELPIPASTTSLCQTRELPSHPKAPPVTPSPTFQRSFPQVPQLGMKLLHTICTPVGLAPTLWWHDSVLDLDLIIRPLVLFLFWLSTTSLIFSVRHEWPAEIICCEGRTLTVHRRLGPWHWRQSVLLAPGTRTHCLTNRRSAVQMLLAPLDPPRHVACLGADGRPLRFGYGRAPEDLERLAAEINTYLEQQETVTPALEQEQQHPSVPPVPVQVNRHAP